MHLRLKWLIPSVLACLPMISEAKLVAFTEKECASLSNPNTVLLVHVTWCGHCRAFKPVYEKVSNLDKYKNWTFYQIEADDLYKVCDQQLDAYPSIYKNNMKKLLTGNRSQAMLEKFLSE